MIVAVVHYSISARQSNSSMFRVCRAIMSLTAALSHMVCGDIFCTILSALAGSRAYSSAERHMIQRPLAQRLLLWVVQLCKQQPEHLLPVVPCQVLRQMGLNCIQFSRAPGCRLLGTLQWLCTPTLQT